MNKKKGASKLESLVGFAFLMWIVYMFTYGGCSGNEESVKQSAWYNGGTLHEATVAEWKKATPQNKLATCGDFIANWWRNDLLKIEIKTVDDIKPYAQEMVDFIDKSTEKIDEVNHYKVSDLASMGAIMMGWNKPKQ